MIKRYSRSQIIILEGGQYILVKHWAKKEDRYFWGIPGGGREVGESDEEAAIREAKEETGLDVKLLPIKIVGKPPFKNSMYDRMATFLAYPVKGEAKIGYDPEEELKQYYELVEIKWQDFYDDRDVAIDTKNLVEGFRNEINSDKVKKITYVLVYFVEGCKIKCLLLPKSNCNNAFVLPSISNIKNYNVKLQDELGFFLKEESKDIYCIKVISGLLESDNKDILKEFNCFDYESIDNINIDRFIKKSIEYLGKQIRKG